MFPVLIDIAVEIKVGLLPSAFVCGRWGLQWSKGCFSLCTLDRDSLASGAPRDIFQPIRVLKALSNLMCWTTPRVQLGFFRRVMNHWAQGRWFQASRWFCDFWVLLADTFLWNFFSSTKWHTLIRQFEVVRFFNIVMLLKKLLQTIWLFHNLQSLGQ